MTLAGGKLTTFRPQAIEVLKACATMLGRPFDDDAAPVFAVVPPLAIPGLSGSQWRRLAGRHGRDLPRLAKLIAELGHDSVGATDTLWAELAFACEAEMVLHLDDLLLRRTRLGLLLPRGGEEYLRPSADSASHDWAGTMSVGSRSSSAIRRYGNAITVCPAVALSTRNPVAAVERSEAAFGGEAVAKPPPWCFRKTSGAGMARTLFSDAASLRSTAATRATAATDYKNSGMCATHAH